ncbi:MAG: beta-phosphoglucomutase family hydrolase [Candidatus Omnitrophica bacterium]|nr:beta-phosphoglucomutase family hydrolase [Candidatus Omnitrophota bacterium]
MSFKGAIFDLDGVIVDTVPLHFKAWKKMFGEYGKGFTFEDYKEKVDGIPRNAGARAILTDISDAELEKAAAKKQGYFLEFLKADGITVYETTRKLIEELRSKSISIAAISSSKNCPYILNKAGLDSLLDAVISGMDIKKGKGKPDPWIFLTAMERLGLKPEECVVFEDAVLGVEAAKRAGMKTVGIDRHNDPTRLMKADIIIKDLGELDYNKLKSLVEK